MDVTPDQKGVLQPQLDVTTSTAKVQKRLDAGCSIRGYTAVLDSKKIIQETRDIT